MVLVPVWYEEDVDIPAYKWEWKVGEEAEKELTKAMGVDFLNRVKEPCSSGIGCMGQH